MAPRRSQKKSFYCLYLHLSLNHKIIICNKYVNYYYIVLPIELHKMNNKLTLHMKVITATTTSWRSEVGRGSP